MRIYRAALERRRRELRVVLNLQAPPPAVEGGDDEASSRTQLLDAMAGRDRLTRELALVEQAIERLNAGTYGVCIDCQGPIAKPRLSVHPEAPRCVRCQEQLERGARALVAGAAEDWLPKLPAPADEDEES